MREGEKERGREGERERRRRGERERGGGRERERERETGKEPRTHPLPGKARSRNLYCGSRTLQGKSCMRLTSQWSTTLSSNANLPPHI